MIVVPRSMPNLPDPSAIAIGEPVRGGDVVPIAYGALHLWGWRCRRAAHAEAEWRMTAGYPAQYTSPKVSDEVEVVWRSHTRPAYVALIVRALVGEVPATLTPQLYSAPFPAVGAVPVWTLRDTGTAWSTAAGELLPDTGIVGAGLGLIPVIWRPCVVWTGDTPRPAGAGVARPLDATAVPAADGLLKVLLTPVDCRIVGVDVYELHEAQVAP